MKNNFNKLSKSAVCKIMMITIAVLISTSAAFAQATTAIGTAKVWGTVDGIAIEGIVQGPSAQVSDLQVACIFEYTEGDIFNSPPALPAALNGLVHLDQDMKGLLTEIRKNGRFLGHQNETLLLTPPKGTLGAKHLLLIGLGDRNKFTPDLMIGIGSIAMREALKLKVTNFAFASDLKDAGIDSPTALVAGNVVKGIFESYRVQLWLKEKKLTEVKPISKVILLAGPSFFVTAGEGIQSAINTIKN